MSVVSSVALHSRTPIWPLFAAPFAAGIYYLVIKSAFGQSIVAVLGQTSATDIDLADIASPHWGSHWIYRLFAEFISAGLATFIAAGIAHGRERAAAIIGGCTISIGFIARVAIHLYVWRYMDPGEYLVPEPWYQHGIDGLMMFAPPILGSYVAEQAEDMHRETPVGFGGIVRAHFTWLWFVAYGYAMGLITPVARIYLYALSPDANVILAVPVLLGNVIPAAAMAIPGYFGLALLSGHLGSKLGAILRNICGIVVLIVGLIAGGTVQFGWYWLCQKIFHILFG